MHRLFVALRPSPPMRDALLATMEGVVGARWQTDAQLHLTLRFIGEVDRHQAEDIVTALDTIHGTPPTIAVEGVGTFETRGRPTSLWAAVRPDAALDHLARAVDRALVRAGVAAETRAFRPHVTLARLPRTAGPIDRWLGATAGLRLPAETVAEFRLYESHLATESAAYTEAARYPLHRL